ncbi:penicillin-binding protein 2 [uncultured Pseudoteredinibacter sp.]|uniref:peptidoglycan D,D-transpeptidase FtsI family protein n=1 Tax=uncultured Pseudoteredinibacter sp. TaxID=1641701 RepID=UPI00262EF694|nr:penicillin-binding protein 2 [uncultured Pseudoteredinibacter sp.]
MNKKVTTSKRKQAPAKGKGLAIAMLAKWRFHFTVAVIALLLLALMWHLAFLQVVPGNERGYEFLQGQGNARTIRHETINAYRGLITDRNGEPLAVSSPVTSVWANPKLFKNDDGQLRAVAKALGLKQSELAAKFDRFANKEFMYLKRHLPPHKAEAVMALGVDGVYATTEYQRFYPAAEVASHLVGFVDVEGKGQEGLELAYDHWLKGEAGAKRVIKDLKGRVIKDAGLIRAALSGKDVRLSIDLRLQYMAHRELKTALKAYKAKSGSVVILDVASSEVLAMVNQPSYNPNNRSKIKAKQLRNRALTDQYEPGSTMKPLTILAALETGKFSKDTVVDTNPGYVRVPGKTFVDPVNYGEINLERILTKSSQVGIVKLALQMEPETIRDIYQRFGLGAVTGTGFPGERTGTLPNRPKWHVTEHANFSFGYGMSLTAAQLAQAYNVIANDGTFRPVSILHHQEGVESHQVADPALVKQVRKMLSTVPEKEGTGKLAQITDYPVAGKTGTVHKLGSKGYAENRYMSLFAGMAPADAPEIVAVVMINEPGTQAYSGGKVAAPVFSRVAESALRLLRVPPRVSDSSQVAMVGGMQ